MVRVLLISLGTFFVSTLRAQVPTASFIALPPCRVVDTRTAPGPLGGPLMLANSSRTFPITSSSCSVPLGAVAYSFNVTVVPVGPLGFLTIFPTGQARPHVSTLNSYQGQIVANAAILEAGTNGSVDVYVTNETDVIIDVDGYFSAAPAQSQPGNTAVGGDALASNTTGALNTAIGEDALYSNTDGSDSVAVGYNANKYGTGFDNTALGAFALYKAGGYGNIGIGRNAGSSLFAGNYNIDIGNMGTEFDSGIIRIGTVASQTSTFIAGISGVNVTNGASVVVDANGKLGVVASSRRYKQDIRDMGDSSDALMDLRPVTFRYKASSEDSSVQYGLIAEEVEQTYPNLVARGKDGQAESVQFQQMPALLLNELQKQHRIIAEQQEQLRALAARIGTLESSTPVRHF